MRILLCFLFLAVAACPAANICVGPSSSGSGSGADWNNKKAWSATPTRGDVWFLEDGSYAGKTFDTAASGTTLITIKKATVADHATATGWSDTMGDGTATIDGVRFATDYFVFTGQTRNESDWTSQVYGFRITGGVTSWPANYPPGGNHITVSYCDIGGTIGAAYGDGGFETDEPVYFVNNTGTSFDFTVSRCFIHNTNIVRISRVDGFTFEYNYCKDMYQKECIRGDEIAKNGVIRYNVFRDTTRFGTEDGTAVIAIWDANGNPAGSFDNWEIYGNLIFDTTTINHTHGAIGVGAGGALDDIIANNVKIYNNTIVGLTGSFAADITTSTSGGATGNEIRNNLWYACIGTPTASPNTSNNGEAVSDPFVNYAGLDFRLSTGIAGTSLSSPYNTDITGATRGADGTFDRGAYEFGSSNPTNRALQRKGRAIALP